MKKIVFALILSLLLSGCNGSGEKITLPNKEAPTQTEQDKPVVNQESEKELTDIKLIPATVVKAIDGDTVKIKVSGKEETVRLLLIDTPETVHPTKPVEPFGPEASDFSKSFFTPGAKIGVEIDVSERDKYGRLLAYLWKDGVMYNREVLKQGLARVAYIYAPNTKYVDDFYAIQKEAQGKAIGIWSVENYATDKGFNSGAVEKQPKEEKKQEAPAPSGQSSSIPDANGDGKCNDVKGNEGSSGNIYHVPGGASYEITKAEQYFCTEQEAEASGFRKSQR